MKPSPMPKIDFRTFEGPATGPHLLITAGVHGDEFEPIAAVRQLIQAFDNPAAANRLFNGLRGTLTLVPCVNRPAFVRGTRCADDGLDLARTCPGRVGGSVTEGIAAELSDLIRAADYYIDLHTGGTEFTIFPLAGYMLHPDAAVLAAQRRMAQAFNLPVVWGTTPHLEGRSLSVARDVGVPAIYTEFGGSATCSIQGIQACIDGCLNVMVELNMIDRSQPERQVTWTVEDSAPQSGHLQICHPSPITGFFQPVVQLGQSINRGQPIGHVWPIEAPSEVAHEIPSEHTGIVLMLRTFPRVRQCQSVGVVLPCESLDNLNRTDRQSPESGSA